MSISKVEALTERGALGRAIGRYINKSLWPFGLFLSGTHYYDLIPELKLLRTALDEQIPMTGIDFDSERFFNNAVNLLSKLEGNVSNIIDRHTHGNVFFRNCDAIFLSAFIRKENPKSIVEIGHGFSTKHMLSDINEHRIDCTITSVDPYARDVHACSNWQLWKS